MHLTPVKSLVISAAVVLFLQACSERDPQAARERMGLPPAGFVTNEVLGVRLYNQQCSICHGVDAQGSSRGPSLLHQGYRPGHHADLAFYQAIRNGVKQHHWSFGDMPPQTQLNTEQAGHIVAYLRSLQRAAGVIE